MSNIPDVSAGKELIDQRIFYELSNLIYFVIALALSIAIMVLLYCINSKKQKNSKHKSAKKVNIDEIAQEACFRFVNSDSKLNFTDKTRSLMEQINYVFNEVADRYYFEDVKKQQLLQPNKLFINGFDVNCKFSINELLNFLDCVFESLETALERSLKTPLMTTAYKGYRLINRNIDKDPENAKLAIIYSMFFNKEKPKENKSNSVVSKLKSVITTSAMKVVMPVVKAGFDIIEPKLVNEIDSFFTYAITLITNDINDLYSHNLLDKRHIGGLIVAEQTTYTYEGVDL